jgi:hypothetical protein
MAENKTLVILAFLSFPSSTQTKQNFPFSLILMLASQFWDFLGIVALETREITGSLAIGMSSY